MIELENVKKALRDISNNFDYNNFLQLLDYIDTRVESSSKIEFDDEFLYYFNTIMSFVNDNVKENDQYITLGDVLITKKLEEHKKLSPTLIIYFYLHMKEMIGLQDIYNKVNFENIGSGAFMCVSSNQDLSIDYKLLKKEQNPEEFNYEMMRKILHEITHIYQFTRTPNSDNEYDVITYYDAQITTEMQKYFDTASVVILHESLPTEFMADEISMTYMLEYGRKHPEQFSSEFMEQKNKIYYERHNGFYKEPRKNLDIFLQEQMQLNKFIDYRQIEQLIEKFEAIKSKQGGLKSIDFVYNMFLNSTYRYDQNSFLFISGSDSICKLEDSYSNENIEKSTKSR